MKRFVINYRARRNKQLPSSCEVGIPSIKSIKQRNIANGTVDEIVVFTENNKENIEDRQTAPVSTGRYRSESVRENNANTNDGRCGATSEGSRVFVPTNTKFEHETQLESPPKLQEILRRKRPKMHQTRRTMVPSEISCHASLASTVDSELETGSQAQTPIAPATAAPHEETRDSHNKGICLALLESDWFDDNFVGMEQLVAMANHELVNSSKFLVPGSDTNHGESIPPLLSSTLAYSLVCNCKSNSVLGETFSARLRAIFPTFLCDGIAGRNDEDRDQNDYSSESSTSSFSCSCQENENEDCNRQNHVSLKLPALRIIVSSLELVLRMTPTPRLDHSYSNGRFPSIDLLDEFWRFTLAYMTDCLQAFSLNVGNGTDTPSRCNKVEAALVVKGFRLLYKLQPQKMGPYVRFSLLPFVSNACELSKQRQGTKHSAGDVMVVRECERLLKIL